MRRRRTASRTKPRQRHLLDLADGVFADWQRIMFVALRREGLAPAHARRLAALVIAATEGTVAMCRAARSAQPLDDVRQELELVLSSALAK
ncbi:LmrA/YxaF family transcription factor [Bradyrhizobium sp. AZCC 1614]|uniref:LmrA/YxaF family transcription factor n=1 Tax=Bradyrhizobium sp. AZCC 1614 TaxID=3117017 RepID=UPI002FF25641